MGDDDDRPPVLLLHGGPGYNSEYLRPFEALAATGRRVIRYDQIGSGRSPVADECFARSGVFSIDLFRRELVALRETLDLREVHLIGQSWGCMLALEHVLSGATGVRSLVLESGLASIAEWNRETLRLRGELPADVLAVLDAEQAAGRTDSEAFKAAYAVWERRHVLRMDHPPGGRRSRSSCSSSDHRVYDAMTGGAEFPTGGATTEFDELGRQVAPRRGRRAHAAALGPLRRSHPDGGALACTTAIAGSEWHILEESSHSCHSEEETRTMVLVADFLARVDAGVVGGRDRKE